MVALYLFSVDILHCRVLSPSVILQRATFFRIRHLQGAEDRTSNEGRPNEGRPSEGRPNEDRPSGECRASGEARAMLYVSSGMVASSQVKLRLPYVGVFGAFSLFLPFILTA